VFTIWGIFLRIKYNLFVCRVIRAYRETQVWLGHLETQDLKERQAGTALME